MSVSKWPGQGMSGIMASGELVIERRRLAMALRAR